VIGVQLWTLRELVASEGWERVVERVAGAGFTRIEPWDIGTSWREQLAGMAATGLTAPTVHGSVLGDDLPRSLDAAAALGAAVLAHPGFEPADWHAPDAVPRIAEVLQRAADAAERYGMRIAFHHHDDDLRPVAGRPALLALMDLVGPGVGVEFDPYWATVAGVDVAAVVEALGPRILALHLKDGPGGSNTEQVPVGQGVVDWPGLLAAVDPGTPRVLALDMVADPWEAVLASRRWLVEHGVQIA
jgi:sugar phosphate isomerase/epimerase